MDTPLVASEGKLSLIVTIILRKAETNALPAPPNPIANLANQSKSDDPKLDESELMADVLQLLKEEYEESLFVEDDDEDEEDEGDEDDEGIN